MKDDNQQSVEGEILQPEQTHSRLLEHRTVERVMEDSFFRYSMSVIIDRALPDVRDGLKPVHRRILFRVRVILDLWMGILQPLTAIQRHA